MASTPGALKIQGDARLCESSSAQTLREKIFQDVWEKGYYLTSALKYGGDFLVYPKHPSHAHSDYVAVVLAWQQVLGNLVALARVAGKANKTVLLCSDDGTEPFYLTLQWAGNMT